MESTEGNLANYPVVDLSAAFDVENAAVKGKRYRAMAEQLVDALKAYGYVYLKTDVVDKRTVDRLMAMANRFFELPTDVKLKHQMSGKSFEGKNGYMGIDFERLDQQHRGAVECRESYNLYDLTIPLQTETDCPGMEEVYYDFYRRCKGVLLTILRALAVGLRLEKENVIESMFQDVGAPGNISMLRIANYPTLASEESREVIRCGTHADYDFITLNFQDKTGGLEMLNRKTNAFVPTPHIDGMILIQTGLALEKVTDGLFTGTKHRVVAVGDNGASKRQSIAFFGQPDNGVLLKNLFRYQITDDGDRDEVTSHAFARQLYEASFKEIGYR